MTRRSSLDQGSVTAGLTNEAYNEVKVVADNMNEVLLVANNISTLSSFDAIPTANGGDGSINGDMDAMDWTGHAHADDSIQTGLKVEETESLIISHKSIFYRYDGAKPIVLGLNGTATVISDYTVIATEENINLSLRFPTGDTAETELANVAGRALKFLGFDAAGEMIYTTGAGATDAAAVTIDDVGDNYTGVEVETALIEVAADFTAVDGRFTANEGDIATNAADILALETAPEEQILGFRASFVSDYTTFGTTAIIWDTEDYDVGNNYNPVTGIFTAPIAGLYTINAQVQTTGHASPGYVTFLAQYGTSLLAVDALYMGTPVSFGMLRINSTIELFAGQYIHMEMNGTVDISGDPNGPQSFFEVRRIGPVPT